MMLAGWSARVCMSTIPHHPVWPLPHEHQLDKCPHWPPHHVQKDKPSLLEPSLQLHTGAVASIDVQPETKVCGGAVFAARAMMQVRPGA